MFKLRCPNCGNYQNYQNQKVIVNKRKVCVYCGKSFDVLKHIIKKIE